ncbi:MAG: hypothetical protein FWB88_07320 [Defluviitaleaceae bacterium]|nr:hypothetical protein [Defluviitaleaceae bacterium]MCL2239295.1 hypothetical protein [Defluviitaleaceae bacterium]
MRVTVSIVILLAWAMFMAMLLASWTGFWVPAEFLDLPTMMWHIVAMTAVIIATGEFKTFTAAVNALFSKKYVLPAATQDKAVRLFRLLGKAVLFAAIIDALMNVSMILLMLDDPGALGPMLSISMLTFIYAAFINLAFVLPAVHILQHRRNAEEKIVISEKQIIDKLLELCYRQGITPEEILDASEISFRREE